MTKKNPYVSGPSLERRRCSDKVDHYPHIVRDEGDPEFLCDGVNPNSELAKIRHRAVTLAMGLWDEPADVPEEVPNVFEAIDLHHDPIDPGPFVNSRHEQDLHSRVEWNMTNHAPDSEDVIARFEALREFAKNFSHAIIDLCPASDDRDLALRHAEDALMRGVAAIARNQTRLLPVIPETIGSQMEENTVSFEGEGDPDPAFATPDDLAAAAEEALHPTRLRESETQWWDRQDDVPVTYVGAPDNDPTKSTDGDMDGEDQD